jgi:hypothetical protein
MSAANGRRGGVVSQRTPLWMRDCHPSPARIVLRTTRTDPPPPGEGKRGWESLPQRHCERSEAIHSAAKKVKMDCFAPLAMTANMPSRSRRLFRASFANKFPPFSKRGRGATPRGERGMPDARCVRSRACSVVSTRVSHHGHTGITRHPRAMVYGLFRALPGDRACLSPSPRGVSSTKLDASVGASGPHGFAVRLKRIRQSAIRVHRIPPHVRDDRETPLEKRQDGKGCKVIWVGREREYFCRRGWTRNR